MHDYDHNERAQQILINNNAEGAIYFTNFAYDTAIIGITYDNRVVYDYNKMVEYLIDFEDMSEEEAHDWLSYNVLSAYVDEKQPIIIFPVI